MRLIAVFLGMIVTCGLSAEEKKQPEEITPNAGPRVANGSDVWIEGDFIYWTARQDGLPYCTTGFGTAAVDATRGSYNYVRSKWSPGFKIGVGLALDHDGWDVGMKYTWLEVRTGVRNTNSSAIYPLWNVANGQNSPSKFDDASRVANAIYAADGSWKLYYNTIDFDLGRNYHISRHLKLRPFLGIKGAWNKEIYNVTYNEVDAADTGRFAVASSEMVQKFWGIGIHLGMNTAWGFCDNWSIFGDWALSEVWSQFRASRKDTEERLPLFANQPDVIFWSQNNLYTMTTFCEMALGLRWEKWWSDDEYHFLAQIGWEEQYLMNFGQWARLMGEQTSGDLSLQGMTIKLRFDF